jgi:hypothetical protein
MLRCLGVIVLGAAGAALASRRAHQAYPRRESRPTYTLCTTASH